MRLPLKAHITEKSYRFISEDKKAASTYTFKIRPSLDKGGVKKMVEETYKVHVESVNIICLPGKNRRFKGIAGRTSDIKKALVRLRTGERIADFEVEQDKKNDKE